MLRKLSILRLMSSALQTRTRGCSGVLCNNTCLDSSPRVGAEPVVHISCMLNKVEAHLVGEDLAGVLGNGNEDTHRAVIQHQ